MPMRGLLAGVLLISAARADEPIAPTASTFPPPASTAGRESYEPEFFARFTPQNALDMVRRVPGFTIDGGDDRRGLSGAVGNVLIDGARPASKSQDISDVLSRIPAAHIERTELIRDVASTADAGGQAMLVNVVRRESAGSGVWEAEAELSENGRVAPRGDATWTGRLGRVDFSVGASRWLEYRPLYGDRVITDGAGALQIYRTDTTPRTWREAGVTGEASWPLLGADIRVNAEIARWAFATALGTESFDPGGARTSLSDLMIDERELRGELGATVSREVGPFDLEMIALASRRRFARDDDTLERNPYGAATSATAQIQRREPGESILRARLSLPVSETSRLDFGAEGAINTLDAELRLSVNGAPIALPSANVSIEEQRSEAFAIFSWRPAARWSLETQLTLENSRLTQTGDANLTTDLVYWKPSIQATRTIGERNQIRARIWRDVDQLDFDDFASVAELADNRVAAGNPNLRPETSWRGEIALDWRFAQDGAFGLTVYRYAIEDVADVVPVGAPPDRFDAPGNIGDGEIEGARLTATLPLDRVMPGARLTLSADARNSTVTDPVTRRQRAISGLTETSIEAEFRHDVPSLRAAWGAAFAKESENVTYRLDEADAYQEGPFLDVWVETTAIGGLKMRAFANAVQDSPFRRTRRFYAGDRNGALVRVERRERHFGSFYGIQISGSFG